MNVAQLSSMIMIGGAVGMFGLYLFYTEVLYPLRIIVKKKREGVEESVLQWGKIKKDKDGAKSLYMTKEKANKSLNEEYLPSITTGFLGRKKYLFELCSPEPNTYFFTRGLWHDTKGIGEDGKEIDTEKYKQDILSQADKQMIIHGARKAISLTEDKKDKWEQIAHIANIMMPIVVVIAIMLLLQVLDKQIVQMFANAADVFIQRISEGAASLPFNQPPA